MWEVIVPVFTALPAVKLAYDKYNLTKEKNESESDSEKLKNTLDQVRKTSDDLLAANQDLEEEVKRLTSFSADLALKQVNVEDLKKELLKDKKLVQRLKQDIKEEMLDKAEQEPVHKHKWVFKSSYNLVQNPAGIKDSFETHVCEKCEMIKRGWKSGVLSDDAERRSGYFLGSEKITSHRLIQFCPFESEEQDAPTEENKKTIGQKILDAITQSQVKKRKKREKL